MWPRSTRIMPPIKGQGGARSRSPTDSASRPHPGLHPALLGERCGQRVDAQSAWFTGLRGGLPQGTQWSGLLGTPEPRSLELAEPSLWRFAGTLIELVWCRGPSATTESFSATTALPGCRLVIEEGMTTRCAITTPLVWCSMPDSRVSRVWHRPFGVIERPAPPGRSHCAFTRRRHQRPRVHTFAGDRALMSPRTVESPKEE